MTSPIRCYDQYLQLLRSIFFPTLFLSICSVSDLVPDNQICMQHTFGVVLFTIDFSVFMHRISSISYLNNYISYILSIECHIQFFKYCYQKIFRLTPHAFVLLKRGFVLLRSNRNTKNLLSFGFAGFNELCQCYEYEIHLLFRATAQPMVNRDQSRAIFLSPVVPELPSGKLEEPSPPARLIVSSQYPLKDPHPALCIN